MGLISWMLLLSGLPALLLSLLPVSDKTARNLARLFSVLVFALSLKLLFDFNSDQAEFQFVEKFNWVPELGISYEVGVDGISLFMLMLTSLTTMAILFSHSVAERQKGFVALFLFLELSLIGVFVALDLILFFVFFELMLLPSFLLINGWGSATANRLKTAITFVIYTALGSALMLCSIIYLGWVFYNQNGNLSFSFIELSQNLSLSSEQQAWLFLGFFAAFAVKTPIVPFHSWLPATYTFAPSELTAFMSAVMAKAGLYGMIRFNWNLFPSGLRTGVDQLLSTGWIADSLFADLIRYAGGFQDFLIWILAISVLYTALIAWSQRNIKSLLAYSSVSHLAICVAAILVCSSASISAAVFFMFSHGLVALGLFLSCGALIRYTGTAEIVELGALADKMPKLACIFFLFLLGSIALPLSSNFVAEFLVLISLFSKYPYPTGIAALSVVLSAVYMLSMYRRVFFGSQVASAGDVKDVSTLEYAVYIPVIALIFILGIFPNSILYRVEPAATKLEQLVFDSNYRDSSNLDYDNQDYQQLENEMAVSQDILTRASTENQTKSEKMQNSSELSITPNQET